MRAWQVTRYGEVRRGLLMGDLAPPTSGADVLVQVKAVALGLADVLACAGEYQYRPELPFVGGLDAVAGTVLDAGVADHLAEGDRVVGLPQPPDGGWAEVVGLPAHRVFAVPAALDDVTAAAMFTGFHTAHYSLHDRARLTAGDTVLVLGAAGAVGSAAVQLAHAAGAVVVAVAGSDGKREACRAMGADVVLDPSDSLCEEIQMSTERGAADIVIDPVGGPLHAAALRCLATEGRLVSIGFASGHIPAVALNDLLLRNATLVGAYWGAMLDTTPRRAHEAHAELVALVGRGAVAPTVHGELAFDEIPGGLERLQHRAVTGKLVARLA